MANNPAFNRMEQDARNGYAGFRSTPAPQQADPMSPQQLQDMYNAPSALRPGSERAVTMDDVMMKTLGLFALVLVTGTAGWLIADANPAVGGLVWIGAMVVTLVLGLVIAFKKTLSVPLIIGYALFEGLFVGAVSQFFDQRYPASSSRRSSPRSRPSPGCSSRTRPASSRSPRSSAGS